MNCPKCGSNINEGEKFCKVCGNQIVEMSFQQQQPVEPIVVNTELNNFQQPEQSNIQQVYQPNTMNQQVNNTQYSNNEINDDELIKNYIGKNAEKLMDNKFSWCSFLFSTMYFLYRKMWFLGLCWLVGSSILTSFLPTYGATLVFVGNIVMAVQFKKLYINHVKEQINKIKSENLGKSREELNSICRNKGGTTIWPVIVSAVIYLIVIVFAMIALFAIFSFSFSNYFENLTDDTTNEVDTSSEYVLKFDIPGGFEPSEYNTDTYLSYSYDSSTDYCTYSISVSQNYNGLYEDAADYLNKNIYSSLDDVVSDIQDIAINNKTWSYVSITSDVFGEEYECAIINNGYIYDIDYNIYQDDTSFCTNSYNDLINSLSF